MPHIRAFRPRPETAGVVPEHVKPKRAAAGPLASSEMEWLRARIDRLRAIVRMTTDERALAVLEALIVEAEARIAELDRPKDPPPD